ncbi:MAG: hypothetical protein Q9M11_01395 [Mariprofundaceae bacterium]|nr:hypothetical protein [Mariprofundaceae bacterium]
MFRGISGLLSLLMLASPSYAEETLQGLITNLRQQQSPQNIEKTLAILKHANIDVLGLPCNGLTCQDARLDVVNLDDLLLLLGQIWHAHPEQRKQIERIVLRWNFCDVNYLNVPHNLVSSGTHQAVSRQAVGRSEGWPGFNQWGFTEHDPDHRIRPELLVKSDLDARSKRQLLYRIERRQCFPNPWNGQTLYDPETLPYNTFYRHIPKEDDLWLQTKVKPKITPVKKEKVKNLPIKKKLTKIARKSVKQHQAHHLALPIVRIAKSSLRLLPSTTIKHMSHLVDQLHSDKSNIRQQVANDTLLLPPLIHGYDNVLLPKSSNLRLVGNIQLHWRLKDNSYGLKSNVQWSPYKHFYIHTGFEFPIIGMTHTPTYTWGLGYANRKANGFSLGWNQWNPQSIHTPLSIKNMDFKLAYDLKSVKLLSLPKGYQSNVSFSFFQGVPALHNHWQYNIGDGWFIGSGISKSFAWRKLYHRNDWGWTYGFGRSKRKDGSFNIEYSNWGFNRIPKNNFRMNGQVLLSWRWKLL